MKPLTIQVDLPATFAPEARYAWATLCETAGIPYRFWDRSGDGPSVYYGSGKPPATARLSLCPADWAKVVLLVPVRRDGPDGLAELVWPENREDAGAAFDPVAASAWLLVWWERQRGILRDVHGRPVGALSPLGALGVLHEPLVNIYAERLLAEARKCGLVEEVVPRWPEGKRFALVLTHDVDSPLMWTSRSLREAASQAVNRPSPSSLARLARGAAGWFNTQVLRRGDAYTLFGAWADFEESIGCRSAFYVSVLHPGEAGYTIRDPIYRADRQPIRAELERLAARGWEIGLHPTYNAFCQGESFRGQKDRLEKMLGLDVQGLRHHVLRLSVPDAEQTLALHEELGFNYDASVIFNDSPGFRRGIAGPYFPAGAASWPGLGLVELGHSIMDNQFLRAKDKVPETQVVHRLIDRIVDVGGCVVLNWHVRSWHERDFPGWREAYCREASRLARSGQAWLALPREVAKWWRKRSAEITGVDAAPGR